MRQITRDAVNAFYGKYSYNKDNTKVATAMNTQTSSLYLHGHRIAIHSNNVLTLSSCGWLTVTTKERLNGVLDKLGMKIYQKQGAWIIYDSKGDSIPFVDGMEITL